MLEQSLRSEHPIKHNLYEGIFKNKADTMTSNSYSHSWGVWNGSVHERGMTEAFQMAGEISCDRKIRPQLAWTVALKSTAVVM